MSKKNTNAPVNNETVNTTQETVKPVENAPINATSIEDLDKVCTSALNAFKAVKLNKDAKASEVEAAKAAMDKAISAYNERVLAARYSAFRNGEVNPLIALFTAGTWDKRKYSAKEEDFMSTPVRFDVFDFIVSSEELKNPVITSSATLRSKLGMLTASIRDRVTEELAQVEDINVSIGAIVKALQAVMDVLALPEFEVGGKKVKVYARPKDVRFLCACSTKASRKLGNVEVLSETKIAAYITDVFYKQITHEEYVVDSNK